MPKVSVIIPNYNHQDFLIQRLESVFNQTYQDFEVILLDDASTDESRKILNNYSNHPKVTQIICNEVNSGSVFKQWIKGFELAKGDYVWIAESDDYAEKTFLETTLKVFGDQHTVGMVFTDTHKVDENGNSLGLVSKSKKQLNELTSRGGIINKTNLSNYLLVKMVIVNASSVLFKREAFSKIDFTTLKKFKNTGDVFTYIGIALKYDILFLSKPLNYMRLHTNSTTKKNKNNGQIYRDKFLMLDYYLKDFNQLKICKKDVVYFLKLNIFFGIDYGVFKKIKHIIKKMVAFGFVSRKDQVKFNTIIFFYRKFTYEGRPHFVRMFFKNFLKRV